MFFLFVFKIRLSFVFAFFRFSIAFAGRSYGFGLFPAIVGSGQSLVIIVFGLVKMAILNKMAGESHMIVLLQM